MNRKEIITRMLRGYGVQWQESLEVKYNKNMLTAMAYMGIGCTLVFAYFIDVGKWLLILGILMILTAAFLYKNFRPL